MLLNVLSGKFLDNTWKRLSLRDGKYFPSILNFIYNFEILKITSYDKKIIERTIY